MRSTFALVLSALVALPIMLSGGDPGPAEALASGYSSVRMEVLIDGRVAREYDGRSKTYVQAFKGKEYSIRLSNDSPERVAVALAVDGLNSIDAKHTAARSATKWVLGPWEQITVDGWQVGSDHARHFVFSSEEASYGAWLGETRNLGNISAVFFREKAEPCCDRTPYTGGGTWDGDFDGRLGDSSGTRSRDKSAPMDDGEARADAPAPRRESSQPSEPSASSGADSAGGVAESESARRGSGRSSRAYEKKDERAATGTGRRVRHSVEWTDFDLDPSPVATLSVRYGFRSELVELGILPAPRRDTSLSRRESGTGFAPDPGSSCCRP